MLGGIDVSEDFFQIGILDSISRERLSRSSTTRILATTFNTQGVSE
jgi:hypothetical protein